MKTLSDILSWFKGGQASPVRAPSNSDELQIDGITSIYFHEDDYRQIELVPTENEAYLIAEGEEIRKSAEKNFDGYGYKGIHVRTGEPIALSTRAIPPQEVADILQGGGFTRIDKVYSGYSAHREHLTNTVAFKLDPYVIYFNHKDGVIQNLWLHLVWNGTGDDRQRMKEALQQLGRSWRLLLAHWPWSVAVDLRDREELENYMNRFPG